MSKGKVLTPKISGEGITRWGLRAIRDREELYDAHAAISCLHDALLAVARGQITPAEVREFFWPNDLNEAEYIGSVLSFHEKETGT